MALGAAAVQSAVWVCFYKTIGDRKSGLVRSPAIQLLGSYFQTPHCHLGAAAL
jgi:hypothetical protein